LLAVRKLKMEKASSRCAEYFSKLTVPSGDPTLWQWPPSIAQRVLEILGAEGKLYRHNPREAEPESYEYPFPVREAESPPTGRGHGGMTYVNWTFGMLKMIDLSIDVTFHTEPQGPAAVYIQLYDFPIGETGQYFGFQYSLAQSGELRTKFIWSRWGTRDKANAWVSDGGWIESAGYEGDFIGIRYPYMWCRGTYTVHLFMRETDEVGTWYEMHIYDHGKSEWVKVGRLRFATVEEELPFIKDGGGSWCEVYGGTTLLRDIARFHVSYGGVYTCGRTIEPKEARFSYGDRTPNSDISIDPDGRRVHVLYGGATTRRTPAGIYGLGEESQ
jgi:hypothetical protein